MAVIAKYKSYCKKMLWLGRTCHMCPYKAILDSTKLQKLCLCNSNLKQTPDISDVLLSLFELYHIERDMIYGRIFPATTFFCCRVYFYWFWSHDYGYCINSHLSRLDGYFYLRFCHIQIFWSQIFSANIHGSRSHWSWTFSENAWKCPLKRWLSEP